MIVSEAKKKLVIVVFLFVSILSFAQDANIQKSINELVIKLEPTIDGDVKPTVALMPFVTENHAEAFEQYLISIINECMFARGKVRIIERDNIDKILQEQKIQLSGNIDDETAKSIGKIIGVDYICFGKVIDMGSSLRITGRTVGVQTGEVCAIGNISIIKDDEIKTILNPSYKSNGPQKIISSSNLAKSNWNFNSYRDDFDSYTVITLMCTGSGLENLVVCYEKNDDKIKSKVLVGIVTPNCQGYKDMGEHFEIKTDNGVIQKILLWGNRWSTVSGSKITGDVIKYYGVKNNNRSLFNIFIDNKLLTFRYDDSVVKFNVDGLSSVLKENGITYEELNNALGNEEF